MKAALPSRSFWRGIAGLVLLLLLWELFARSGLFTQALTPPLSRIARVAWRILLDGSLLKNAAYTLARVLAGLLLACLVGIPVGILMGRFRAVERFFLPLGLALVAVGLSVLFYMVTHYGMRGVFDEFNIIRDAGVHEMAERPQTRWRGRR